MIRIVEVRPKAVLSLRLGEMIVSKLTIFMDLQLFGLFNCGSVGTLISVFFKNIFTSWVRINSGILARVDVNLL